MFGNQWFNRPIYKSNQVPTLNARPKVVEKIFENESSDGCSITVPLNRADNLFERLGFVPDSKVAAQTKEMFSKSFFCPD